jgi:hypothetical protein
MINLLSFIDLYLIGVILYLSPYISIYLYIYTDIGVDCTILNNSGNLAFALIKNQNDRKKIEFLHTGIFIVMF